MYKSIIFIGLFIVNILFSPLIFAEDLSSYALNLSNKGIINSHSDIYSYHLESNISRGEVMKLISKSKNSLPLSGCPNSIQSVFYDVFNSEFCTYIQNGLSLSLISTQSHFFRPKDPITRGELVKLFIKQSDLIILPNISAPFQDISQVKLGDLYTYIINAQHYGIISSGKLFRPNDLATRGEAFKIFTKILSLKKEDSNSSQSIQSIYSSLTPTTSYSGTSIYSTSGNINNTGATTSNTSTSSLSTLSGSTQNLSNSSSNSIKTLQGFIENSHNLETLFYESFKNDTLSWDVDTAILRLNSSSYIPTSPAIGVGNVGYISLNGINIPLVNIGDTELNNSILNTLSLSTSKSLVIFQGNTEYGIIKLYKQISSDICSSSDFINAINTSFIDYAITYIPNTSTSGYCGILSDDIGLY